MISANYFICPGLSSLTVKGGLPGWVVVTIKYSLKYLVPGNSKLSVNISYYFILT